MLLYFLFQQPFLSLELRGCVGMIEEEITVFRGFMEIEERSIHTIRQYLDILNWFESFLQEKDIKFQELTENDIVAFQLWIRNKHLVNQYMRIHKKPPTKSELVEFSKTTKKLGGKSLYKYLRR